MNEIHRRLALAQTCLHGVADLLDVVPVDPAVVRGALEEIEWLALGLRFALDIPEPVELGVGGTR
jgi:hypothetical protein